MPQHPHSTWLVKTLGVSALSLGLWSLAPVAGQAARFDDGRILFDAPPTLVEATTRDQQAGASGRYHFVVSVPENAGEALEAIAIAPLNGQRPTLRPHTSQARLGTAYSGGPVLPLANIGGVPNVPGSVLAVFERPVLPGETVTVTVQTPYNPWGGVYLFGVTAYPAGEGGVGQFLGYGRIHIYDNDK